MMQGLAERIEQGSIPEPNSGCWLWLRGSIKPGYGVLRLSRDETDLAHRASWRAYRGEIPPDTAVLHSCDTPPCVNPRHLFLGTQLDNIRDREAKQRTARGEHVEGRRVLTEADVLAIRADAAVGAAYPDLARRFGVVPDHIGRIVRRRSWRHS